MIQLNFQNHAEMLAFFDAVVAPRYIAQPTAIPAVYSAPVTALVEAAPAHAPVVKEAPKKAAPKPKGENPAATPAASETATTETTPVASAPSAPAAESPSEAAPAPTANDYTPVGAAITRLVNDGQRDRVLEALAKFGAKKGPELKPEQYAAFMQEIGQ